MRTRNCERAYSLLASYRIMQRTQTFKFEYLRMLKTHFMHLCLSTLDIYIYIYRPIYIYTEVRVYIILFLSLSLSPRLYVLNLSACSRAHHNRSALRKQRRKKPHPFQISLNLHLQSLFLCPDLNQLIFSTCLRVSEHSIVVSPHHCLPTEFS